ncbi:MAG: TldD/PmbA family protein [Deltaproteobacteria bacterium]|nr:MAG: TldD/PmbA family protein [Deltaproteobacteria bacterium]
MALGEQVVAAAQKGGATTAEVAVREGSHLSTTVRMRETELLEEAGSRSLGLRVMVGQQVAVSYTSDLSDQGVARLVEDALELAQLSEPDPFAGAPDPALLSTSEEHQDFDLFDEEMGTLGAGEALARAKEAEAAALDYDERITNSDGASFSRAAGGGVLVTSGGFRGATRGTYASLSVVPMAKESDGKNRRGHYWTAKRHLAELKSAEVVGVTAAQRTLRKLGAKKVETQEAPVIFNDDTARSILGLLAGCVNGSAIWRKSSYLLDREGERIASDLITIVDDPLIPKAPGSRPYDGEGLLSRKNVVVENGVLKTYLLDSYSARKLEKESTASASRGSSGGVGPSTTNFILSAGDITHDELVGSTKSGLYVTEMMGFGFNAVTGDFSRGAAGFWIENGELAYPVSEITISLNLDDLLKRIDAVADDLDLRTSIASPSFRVSAMTIAGS